MEQGKLQIVKNVIVLSFGFIFLFTGYNGISYLQSTINQHHGIGVVSQAVIYAGFCVASILLPKYFIKKFGCKTTLLIAMVSYLPYICSNFYPYWITMIPSAILVGLGAPLLWASQCTYLNKSSILYSSLVQLVQNADDGCSYNISMDNSSKNTVARSMVDNNVVHSDDEILKKRKSSTSEIKCGEQSNDCNLREKKCEDQIKLEKESRINSEIFCNNADRIVSISQTAAKHTSEHKNYEQSEQNFICDIGNECKDTLKDSVKVTNLSVIIAFSDEKSDYKLKCDIGTESKNSTEHHPKVPDANFSEDIFGVKSHNNRTQNCDNDLCDCTKWSSYNSDEKEGNECVNNLTQNNDSGLKDCTRLCQRAPYQKSDLPSGHHSVGKRTRNTCKEARNILKDSVLVSDAKIIEGVAARFFGFNGLAYHTTNIWSNLISYYILQKGSDFNGTSWNSTSICGAQFCNLESTSLNPNLIEPTDNIRNILTSIAAGLSLVAMILVFFFLDHLQKDEEQVTFSFDLLTATCRFVRGRQPLLLGPLSFYIGMQQAFYIGDFTKSYIGCAWGASHVGLVTICYGFSCAFSSTFSGLLVKYIGRVPIFITAAIINIAANVLLLFWKPDHRYPLMFFVLAGMWGLCTGMFWSQLRAFYGVLFKKDEEAAFSGFYLWDSLGYCLAFSYSNYICTSIKIYALLFVSTVGVLGYLKAEFNYQIQKRQTVSSSLQK